MDICIKMDKIDNLFTTIKQTPIHIIKTTLNKITNNIIEQIEKNELENDIYLEIFMKIQFKDMVY